LNQSTFQYDFRDLNLTVSQIERVLGYQQGESEETIRNLIADILKDAEQFCEIKAEYRIFREIKFHESEKNISINRQSFNIKKIVYGQLKKSASIAIFLCTAGDQLGIRSRKEMKEGDLLKGYIIDVIGSEIAESAVDLMQQTLEDKLVADGLRITNRFSPGYCGWNVAEQHKLFSLMPDNYCGIRLTESALMDPVKSVSGFIGIGEKVKRLPYTCSFCDMTDCIYRKARGG
jgi:hypothetical protein